MAWRGDIGTNGVHLSGDETCESIGDDRNRTIDEADASNTAESCTNTEANEKPRKPRTRRSDSRNQPR